MDIVERLMSMYYELSRRQASTPFGERSELDGIPTLLYDAATKIQDLQGNEIERLRKERDEARQEICIRVCDTLGAVFSGSPATPQDYAEEMGWDCFKENTNG
jgi:hypothetical protein